MKLLASTRCFILPFNTAIILPEYFNPCTGELRATTMNTQVFVGCVAVGELPIYSQGPRWLGHDTAREVDGAGHGERWPYHVHTPPTTSLGGDGPGAAVSDLLSSRTSETMGRGRRVYLAKAQRRWRLLSK